MSYLRDNLLNSQTLTAKAILEDKMKYERKNKIEVKYTGIAWSTVWNNISSKVLSSDARTAWYKAVNNIISTNERLFAIGLSDTNLCSKCHLIDTVPHRFMCGDRVVNWKWTSEKIAKLTRTSADNISPDILYRPQESYFPKQKNNAVIWLLGKYISYVLNNIGNDNHIEYKMYMETEFAKTLEYGDHKKKYGNMLLIAFNRMGVG